MSSPEGNPGSRPARDPAVLEQDDSFDRGSERMRADLHAGILREGQQIQSAVEVLLAPYRRGLQALAAAALAAPCHEMSGERLGSALIDAKLGVERNQG